MKLINPCDSGGGLAVKSFSAVQTRTQATYSAAAQGVVAMTSDLDLSITVPAGTSNIKLDWEIYGEDSNANAHGFVVYKDVDGGGYSLLPESRDGSSSYWSVITRCTWDGEYLSTANTTPVSVIDTSPDEGSVVTYRLYIASIRASGTGTYYLNRCLTNSGGSLYPSGSSTGELKCY